MTGFLYPIAYSILSVYYISYLKGGVGLQDRSIG